MTICSADGQFVIEERGPIPDVRVRSRRATLSDCACFLRVGVDVCVLTTSKDPISPGENSEPVIHPAYFGTFFAVHHLGWFSSQLQRYLLCFGQNDYFLAMIDTTILLIWIIIIGNKRSYMYLIWIGTPQIKRRHTKMIHFDFPESFWQHPYYAVNPLIQYSISWLLSFPM